MEIKKCTQRDIKEVYNLICELENTKFEYKKFEIAFTSKINNDKNYYILGIENNFIIGFLSLNIDYQLHHASTVATIEELIVNNKYRSKGFGKLLVENAINYARKNNCDVIELASSFDREKAHNFYEKMDLQK